MNFKEDVIEGILNGYPLIPTKNKVPIVSTWKTKDNKYNVDVKEVETKFRVNEIALMMGSGIEAVDIDTKYDITGSLYDDYCNDINAVDDTILGALTIQRTESGGYHFIYKCEGISDGNKKLAQREATEDEKEKGDRVKVLLETRGIGGYICIEPTKGYEIIQGDILNPETITLEQRNVLFDVAKSFNSYKNKEKESPIKSQIGELTPFNDYDERTSDDDILGLLVSHGWTIISQTRNKVAVRRGGDTKAKHSGYYFTDSRRLFVHSTSTLFEAETLYKPYAIYTILEFGGDYSAAALFLSKNGYGTPSEKRTTTREPETRREVKRFNKKEIGGFPEIDEDVALSYISDGKEALQELYDFYDGRVPPAYKTGNDAFDDWMVLKEHTFYTLTANMGTGKTTTMQFLQVMYSKVNDNVVWGIQALENSQSDYRENLLNFVTGSYSPKLLRENPKQWHEAMAWIDAHFVFFEPCGDLETLLSVVASTIRKTKITALFIDPINSIPPARNAKWEYSTAIQAASQILSFRRNVCSVFVSQHPVIGKQRDRSTPQSVDGEFGALINKADMGIVLSRNRGEQDSNITELIIDKNRTAKRGGRETFAAAPIKLAFSKEGFSIEAPAATAYGFGQYRNYYRPFPLLFEKENSDSEKAQYEKLTQSDIESCY